MPSTARLTPTFRPGTITGTTPFPILAPKEPITREMFAMPTRFLTLLVAVLAMTSRVGLAEEDGFKPLFNGKDLSGWVLSEKGGLFSVENGEIVGRTKGDLEINQFLVTEATYRDFDLKAKVKFINGNSGIQFRSKRLDNGAVVGPQADVADQYWGLLYEERGRGILERYPEEKARELVHQGDWNEFEIIARGDHVQIFLNGTKVIDRTDPEFDDEGIIALQVHVGPPMEVRFKDIEIKTLD